MYRALVMFPKSAGGARVDTLVEGIHASFTATAGFLAISRSAGALMGPGAKAGDVGWILEADFDSLEDVMAALHADSFQEWKTATESVGATIFLFEVAAG